VVDGTMARDQRYLVYSIDAILGLTGSGQLRSSSTTVGRHLKCCESEDAFELQPKNAATSQNRPTGRLLRTIRRVPKNADPFHFTVVSTNINRYP